MKTVNCNKFAIAQNMTVVHKRKIRIQKCMCNIISTLVFDPDYEKKGCDLMKNANGDCY